MELTTKRHLVLMEAVQGCYEGRLLKSQTRGCQLSCSATQRATETSAQRRCGLIKIISEIDMELRGKTGDIQASFEQRCGRETSQ